MSWILGSAAVLAFALALGFAWWERERPSSRVLAIVATLAALAALGRIAFAPLPSIKPTTDIVLIAGAVLGPAAGFVVGAVGALASNVFFGQGPWTPWQMAAWGAVGIGGALLARVVGREIGRLTLAVACAVAGLAYGLVMDLSAWMTFSGDHSLDALLGRLALGVPFNVAHAAGNVVFCLAFGPALLRTLARYRSHFEVTWLPVPAPGPVAGVALVAMALAAIGLGLPSGARAQAPERSVRYLVASQNADGGFPGAPGQSSTELHSGWAGLGLAAAGRNPLDVRRGGRGVLDYTRAQGKPGDLGALERTILLFASAGRPARIGSRNLAAELVARRRPNGSFAGRVNTTAFAVLALRASGRSSADGTVRAAGRWIAGQANPDGGFNFSGRGGPSGVDDTGAALQALAAAGRGGSRTVGRAASFLARRQNPDGGFPLTAEGPSNAQSTAWAVQGLVAAGRSPARVRRNGARSPLGYLQSLVGPDGAVRYSRTSTQTPVWVTAQAVMALERKAFPFAAVPRRARRAPAGRARATRGTGASVNRRASPRSRPSSSGAARRAPGVSPSGLPGGGPLGPPAPSRVAAMAHDAGLIVGLAAQAAY